MQSQLYEQDPWNWKFPQRSDLMALNSLSWQKDRMRVKTAKGLRTNRTTSNNMFVDDIHKSKPKLFIPETVTRPSYIHSNHDIVGSQPRGSFPQVNCEFNYFSNNDIPGSKPDCQKFKTEREPCNPLNPTYKLQSFEVLEPLVPKFIRDAIDNSDIEGAKKKVKKEVEPRDTFKVDDI